MTSGMNIFRTYIFSIAALLSVATAVLSCSVGVYDAMTDIEGVNPEKSIVITGAVYSQDGQPLEDISITFKSYPQDDAEAAPLMTERVSSNSKGEFLIMSEGADFDLFCILTAEDPKEIYESQNQQIFISWGGVDFDETTNTRYVNDCSFVLDRK